MLVPVSEASVPALDVPTYRARLRRWQEGQGPRLTGMPEFVRTLETRTTPTRAVVVSGERTTYTFLLDDAMSRVVAALAVDSPPPG